MLLTVDHAHLKSVDTTTGKNEDDVTFPVVARQTSTQVQYKDLSVTVPPRELMDKKEKKLCYFPFKVYTLNRCIFVEISSSPIQKITRRNPKNSTKFYLQLRFMENYSF